MLHTYGDSPHVIAVIKQYLAFTDAVRSLLPDVSPDHAGDVAAKIAELDPRLVREPDRIPAALEKLRADDPLAFAGPVLGQHLFRLLAAASPGGDLGTLRAAVDRMDVESNRRCSYHAKKKLLAEGKPVPEPLAGETNIACSPRARTAKPGVGG